MSSKLFSPIQVGQMLLDHRVALAPMTRFRADDDYIPLPMVKDYYEQRASVPGTLLITEATYVSPSAGGYPNIPGIWNTAQIARWRTVTDAVHAKGCYTYLQIWGLGRVANPDLLKDHGGLVSSSAVPLGPETPIPREMSEEEIYKFIADFTQAAKNAIAAGFDGVEVHAASGYLIDQFIQDTCNKRTDSWGGSIENRSRFALEVLGAVSDAIGANRTAVRYTPFSTFQGMRMADPIPQFSYLAKKTAELGLAYVHLVEPRVDGSIDVNPNTSDSLDFFFNSYGAGPIIVAGGYKPVSAKEAVESRYKDNDTIIAIGRLFTSNPDLPFRFKKGIALRAYERDCFYMPKDPRGYIDYDFCDEYKSVKVADVTESLTRLQG
ncbi:NADH:flavin oxidoreductase/NADH oxidase family protein [Aspergillus bertholletiae]|uniref:NADH:flavin oxidoreductase/NADH oxidase family protein n=1 Tax=Aspergillus bertholletiae TaxID=1226010 RepID=A0A5N7BJ49_9EURO|nr:NADH:flavin oxidoreductase/NADH oxidase family protein [Aspergillus bertholletiae]